jgi:rSAM/selenodomain-associated transferase 1
MRRAFIVVGKAPEPGRTKTRLVPPLTSDGAADLYRGFLLDAVQLGLELGWERTSVVHARGAAATLEALLPREACLLEQVGSGLADALAYAFQSHFADGFDRVVLIGSDSPTLSAEPVIEACEAIEHAHDLAIGPSADGGYYLVAMRHPHLGVFQGIEWSTSRVYAQTIARTQALGLRVKSVREWYDIDEPADLERLQRELRSSSPGLAPHTRAALARIADQAGGTSSVGSRPERSEYTRATRSPTLRPEPLRASITTEPPKPPPVIRAP